jgi:hypothetical protein
MRWKKRVADLITPDAAKLLASCIPELRTVLGVTESLSSVGVNESLSSELALDSTEAMRRLKALFARLFSTFPVRNKVQF